VTATATGTVTADGVRFERLYDATPAELWTAITDPEQIKGWLAHTTRWSLTPGEEWSIRFDDGAAGGRVVAVDEGRVLELTWVEEENESLLRFEIVPRDAGCLLVLEHTRLEGPSRIGFGAGWQSHLEALDRLLQGGDEFDWWERYRELRPLYEEKAGSLR
jgi:uncharacterized protein YndB with AHSA1/START domain